MVRVVSDWQRSSLIRKKQHFSFVEQTRGSRAIFLSDFGQYILVVLSLFYIQQWRGSSKAQWRGMFSAGYTLFLMYGLGVCQ